MILLLWKNRLLLLVVLLTSRIHFESSCQGGGVTAFATSRRRLTWHNKAHATKNNENDDYVVWKERRHCFKQFFFFLGSIPPLVSVAAETVGKDPDCNDSTCLGVWDGLLADCPHDTTTTATFIQGGGAGCVSSQDDTPGIFAEPWDYSEAPNQSMDWQVQMNELVPAIQLVSSKRGDSTKILLQEGRYLRMLFTDGKTSETSIGEFYFTPNDTTVQFRVASTSHIRSSFANKERCEMIRKQLRYLKIPVLRNRKRTLIFVESDLDTFGPGSAALGPPAEMETGELEGRNEVGRYPTNNAKTDYTQAFPFPTNK